MAPTLPRGKVVLPDAYGGTHIVQVEIAATRASRQRGLMWRKELPAGSGMLFIFPRETEQSFWMRNTLIPLDIVFITREGRIVRVEKNAEPNTLVSRPSGAPCTYVLEVPGGWIDQAGVTPGAKVELFGIEGVEVEP